MPTLQPFLVVHEPSYPYDITPKTYPVTSPSEDTMALEHRAYDSHARASRGSSDATQLSSSAGSNAMSPQMSQADYNQLLEAFTNSACNNSGEYAPDTQPAPQSPISPGNAHNVGQLSPADPSQQQQQNYHQQTMPPSSGYQFIPNQDAQPLSDPAAFASGLEYAAFPQQYGFSYGQPDMQSSVVGSYTNPGGAIQFADGLRIHPAHYQVPGQQQLYQQQYYQGHHHHHQHQQYPQQSIVPEQYGGYALDGMLAQPYSKVSPQTSSASQFQSSPPNQTGSMPAAHLAMTARPNVHTVATLEEAAARSDAYPSSAQQASQQQQQQQQQQQAGTSPTAGSSPSGSGLQKRQQRSRSNTGTKSRGPASRRGTIDGVAHMASLSISSPRHSVSAASSVSSAQNSPTTPISAYSADTSSTSFHSASNYSGYSAGPSSAYGLAKSVSQHSMLQQPYSQLSQLSMSVPAGASGLRDSSLGTGTGIGIYSPAGAGFSKSGYQPFSGVASVPLSQSHGRLSSAGLMDQLVSSRKAQASPEMPDSERMQSFSDLYEANDPPEGERRSSKASSRSSGSRSRTSTPPTTPARLRSKRNSGSSTATVPAPVEQTPSSVGPHRTPSKRALQNVLESPAVLSGGSTPQRPNTLRRSTSEYSSHTPKTAKRSTVHLTATLGLASPSHALMPLDASARAAKSPHGNGLDSSLIGGPAANGSITGSMMRTQSSPGFGAFPQGTTTANSHTTVQQQYGDMAIMAMSQSTGSRPSSSSSQHANSARSNRGATLSALQMSPLTVPTNLHAGINLTTPSPISGGTGVGEGIVTSDGGGSISVSEALASLDKLSAFLSWQASQIPKEPKQPAHLVLGTHEQSRALEDLRVRLQARASATNSQMTR